MRGWSCVWEVGLLVVDGLCSYLVTVVLYAAVMDLSGDFGGTW